MQRLDSWRTGLPLTPPPEAPLSSSVDVPSNHVPSSHPIHPHTVPSHLISSHLILHLWPPSDMHGLPSRWPVDPSTSTSSGKIQGKTGRTSPARSSSTIYPRRPATGVAGALSSLLYQTFPSLAHHAVTRPLASVRTSFIPDPPLRTSSLSKHLET